MTSCACCAGACCAADGTCSQETKAACDSAGGVWHGAGTDCADYDCTSGCCEEVTLDTCTLSICKRGYDAGTCAEECDPATVVDAPPSGVAQCKDGTPSSVTVTGSGVTFSTYDPDLTADLTDAMNASYGITFRCDGLHSGGGVSTTFAYPGTFGTYDVIVTVRLYADRFASISIIQGGSVLARMERSDGLATIYTGECDSVYECDLFSGAPTATGGTFGDYTNATIGVS